MSSFSLCKQNVKTVLMIPHLSKFVKYFRSYKVIVKQTYIHSYAVNIITFLLPYLSRVKSQSKVLEENYLYKKDILLKMQNLQDILLTTGANMDMFPKLYIQDTFK